MVKVTGVNAETGVFMACEPHSAQLCDRRAARAGPVARGACANG